MLQPEFGEICDFGSNNGQPGFLCSLNCNIPGTPPPPPGYFCGDGVIQKGEECDDGNNRDYDGCSNICKREQYECGNGIVESGNGEQCDNGALNGTPESLCDAQCRLKRPPQCGDGVLDRSTEECDLGAGFNRNGQDSECLENCLLPYCGDGFTQYTRGEQCDDGNLYDSDGCSHLCRTEVIEAAPPEKPIRIPTPAKSEEGPGLVIFLASGAAAGFGLMRRKLFARK